MLHIHIFVVCLHYALQDDGSLGLLTDTWALSLEIFMRQDVFVLHCTEKHYQSLQQQIYSLPRQSIGFNNQSLRPNQVSRLVTFDLSSVHQPKQYNSQPSKTQSLQYPAIRTLNITTSEISIINIQPLAPPSLQYPKHPKIKVPNNQHPPNYNIHSSPHPK